MSEASHALSALATALAVVAPVRTGRAALETTSATLPVITIWNTDDRPAADPGCWPAMQYTRTVVIEVKVAATETYPAVLDDALSGIRRALQTSPTDPTLLSGHATEIRQIHVRFFAPADNGDAAILQLTLEIDYLDRL